MQKGRSPEVVLACLSRYTHRVAISNRRLIAADASTVTFNYKDYRVDGAGRFKTMTLATDEFIRRFPMHVLPRGFHRIRHYGLLANSGRAGNVAKARELLAVPLPVMDHRPENAAAGEPDSHEPDSHPRPCPFAAAA
jgi:Putative transposase